MLRQEFDMVPVISKAPFMVRDIIFSVYEYSFGCVETKQSAFLAVMPFTINASRSLFACPKNLNRALFIANGFEVVSAEVDYAS